MGWLTLIRVLIAYRVEAITVKCMEEHPEASHGARAIQKVLVWEPEHPIVWVSETGFTGQPGSVPPGRCQCPEQDHRGR